MQEEPNPRGGADFQEVVGPLIREGKKKERKWALESVKPWKHTMYTLD